MDHCQTKPEAAKPPKPRGPSLAQLLYRAACSGPSRSSHGAIFGSFTPPPILQLQESTGVGQTGSVFAIAMQTTEDGPSLQPDPLVAHVRVVPGAVPAARQLWEGRPRSQGFTRHTSPRLATAACSTAGPAASGSAPREQSSAGPCAPTTCRRLGWPLAWEAACLFSGFEGHDLKNPFTPPEGTAFPSVVAGTAHSWENSGEFTTGPSVLCDPWGRLWKRTREGGEHQGPPQRELRGAGEGSGLNPGGLSVGAATGLGGQRSPAGPPTVSRETMPRGHKPTPTGKGAFSKSQGPWAEWPQKAAPATVQGGPATEPCTVRETLQHCLSCQVT